MMGLLHCAVQRSLTRSTFNLVVGLDAVCDAVECQRELEGTNRCLAESFRHKIATAYE